MDFVEDGSSDLGSLWKLALDEYSKECGVDLRTSTQASWHTSTIMQDMNQQVSAFTSWRHNKGKTDKIRTLFARNADIIQGLAGQIASAATAAFPPASALLTAFTYVLSAAKGVSDDFDMIESFFDIMNGFLERLKLLESKLPPENVYQMMLLRVFSSILNLSAIARSYRKSGRFSKWAKSMVDHQDPKLKDAYNLLQKHLSRLESMTLMATLKQTLVISKDMTALGTAVNVLGTKMDIAVTLTQQNITLSTQNLNVGLDTRVHAEQAALAAAAGKELSEEALAAIRNQNQEFKDFAKLFKQQQDRKGDRPGASEAGKQTDLEAHDSGDKKAVALAKIRRLLDCQQYLNIQSEQKSEYTYSFVNGTFKWFEDEEVYQDFVNERAQVLWISGESGMGKSTLSSYITDILTLRVSDDTTSSVCQFFIREDYSQLRSIGHILRACAIQIALQDGKYRDSLLNDLQQNYLDAEDDALTVFDRLFVSKYPKDGNRKTIIILDGVDELTEVDFSAVREMITTIAKAVANIQFVFTSDQSFIAEDDRNGILRLNLDKDKIWKDMWKIALARTKTMPRLRKLRIDLRRKIASRLRQKADNLRYIEHMARKLNALGAREGPILKELDRLPESTEKLYELLLEECQRHRTPEELRALRTFFAWLAYSKRHVSLGEANRLIQIIATDSGISIDEELDGKSARLLRLANASSFEEKETDSSDVDAEDHEEDEDEETVAREDLSVLLGFQERALRAYFRASNPGENGLRSSASVAHMMILEIISRSFMVLRDEPTVESEIDILKYGSQFFWAHLLEIDAQELNDDQVKTVVENLYVILDNKNNAMKKIQLWCDEESFTPSIFGHTEESSERTLAVIQKWAERAIRLPSTGGQFSTIQEWFRPLVQNPSRIYIGNARAHIRNWFQTSEWQYHAAWSFRYAHEALRKAYLKELPELKQNPRLRDYFDKYVLDPARLDRNFTEESILTVATAFWDLSQSYRGAWSIAMALKFERFYEAAQAQCRIGLDLATDDSERSVLYYSMGETLLQLSKGEESDDAKKAAYITEACENFAKAVVATSEKSITAESDYDYRLDCANLYMDSAQAEFLAGDVDKMSTLVSKAVAIPGVSLFVRDLLDPITDAEAWPAALKMLKLFKRVDRMWYLNSIPEKTHLALQKAALELGQSEFIIEMYSECVRFLEQGRLVGYVRLSWADYHWRVRGETTRAKELLYGFLNYITIMGVDSFGTTTVSTTIWRIVDILVEEFRNTTNPTTKTKAFDEVKSILLRLKETLGDDFDPSLSQTTVPLALMTRKLGPAVEFEEILKTSFDGCIANLSDNEGWNDVPSLRILAKVLSCLGLEKEAAVAASAQLYVLNMAIYTGEPSGPDSGDNGTDAEPDLDPGISPEKADEGSTQKDSSPATSAAIDASAISDISTNSDVSALTTTSTLSKTTTDNKPEVLTESNTILSNAPHVETTGAIQSVRDMPSETSETSETDEDINYMYSSLNCDECGKIITTWKDDSAYLCLYCTEIDICGTCFATRLQRETGKQPHAWRILCPKGHKYIKAPVEGWGGIKNGVITIGDEKITFMEWLKDLKDVKWPNAWKAFWAEEMA